MAVVPPSRMTVSPSSRSSAHLRADPGLFVGMAEGPHGVGGLLGGLAGTGGAAVHPAADAVAFEGLEVTTHGHLRAAQGGGQGRHLHFLSLAQGFDDLAATPGSVHWPSI